MVRSAVGKVVWVGKGAAFLVGLVVILAAMLAVASVAAGALLGADGGSSPVGEAGGMGPISRLAADGGAGLAVDPVARRRQIEFTGGFAQVNLTSDTATLSGSKGINGCSARTTTCTAST